MHVSSRHHLRSDEVRDLQETLSASLGVTLDGDSFELVEFSDADFDLVLVDGEPMVWYVEHAAGDSANASGEQGSPSEEPFLTVTGANEFPPEHHVVTVDAGAVSFVSDGADVMRPGIVEADEEIAAGDLVVIEEETHGKALAVGRAMTDGDDMLGDSGKVVKSLHYVGDDLYRFTI